MFSYGYFYYIYPQYLSLPWYADTYQSRVSTKQGGCALTAESFNYLTEIGASALPAST